jgi:hypothetical protein
MAEAGTTEMIIVSLSLEVCRGEGKMFPLFGF